MVNRNGTISEKGQKSSTKMVPFQSEKGQNSSKKGIISEKGQNSSTKIVPLQKRVTNPQQKWHHFRKRSKFLNNNVTFPEKGQKSSTKMVLFQSEMGHNFSTKKVPFQKRVKIPQQKWYLFRRGAKIVNKNGTISEKCQNSSTKWYHFRQKRVKISQQKWHLLKKGSKGPPKKPSPRIGK